MTKMMVRGFLGLDLVRCFNEEPGVKKNLYQLLREGKAGEFNGRTLKIGNDFLEVLILVDMYGEGAEMLLGRLLREEEMKLWNSPEETMVSSLDIHAGFSSLAERTRKLLASLGTATDPRLYFFVDQGASSYTPFEYDFFSQDTVKQLRARMDEFLEKGIDPFSGNDFSWEPVERTVDPEKVRENWRYCFIMEEMGKGGVLPKNPHFTLPAPETVEIHEVGEKEISLQLKRKPSQDFVHTNSGEKSVEIKKKGFLARLLGK